MLVRSTIIFLTLAAPLALCAQSASSTASFEERLNALEQKAQTLSRENAELRDKLGAKRWLATGAREARRQGDQLERGWVFAGAGGIREGVRPAFREWRGGGARSFLFPARASRWRALSRSISISKPNSI
jgi:hypothetical protein